MGQFNSALDGLPRTSFGTVIFPCAHHRLHGSFRKHMHQYPHRAGEAPEKLGRSSYSLSVRGVFHATLEDYPDLYPHALNHLQEMYEQGKTDTFVHPTVGKFQAFIGSWERETDPRVRSGEVVDIEFVEDQASDFLTKDIFDSAHFAAISSDVNKLRTQLDAVQAKVQIAAIQSQLFDSPAAVAEAISAQDIAAQVAVTPQDLSLFDALQTVANDITGIGDTANLYGNLVSAKADQLASICAQLDRSISLQDARAFLLLDALHDVWALAVRIQQDVQQQRATLQTWNVPSTMPLTNVSTSLYGSASRTDDLLALNGPKIDNVLAVRAGTPILYYPAA